MVNFLLTFAVSLYEFLLSVAMSRVD